MDTRALRYFQAVAEFGSYSRGAEFLRISQPAVSRQIRGLEQDLGCALFVRHSHGVSLTEAGRTLLERSQAILRQFEQAREAVRSGESGASGTVTLAVPPAAGTFLVPELTRRFGALFPGVFLKIAAGFSVYIHEWLVRGRVDAACLHDPVPQPGFVVTPLAREEVFLVGKAGLWAPPRGHVRTQDLADVPLILPARPNASRRLLDSWLARRGVRLNVRVEADDHLIIRALVRDGLGCSLLTQGAFLADLRLGELQAWPFRPRAYWGLALMETPAERRSRPVAALGELVRETVRDLVRAQRWPGAQVPD
ncbi:MAG TPA: LysR family transcriptional regulator [Acetobacteraceae bacterium]|nr:LysR family transcriptional regulator [Acetobacteraceae bacterium]